MRSRREVVGICDFMAGGIRLAMVPVYVGEEYTDLVIYERAARSMQVLDVTRARLLPACTRKFIATKEVS